MLHRYKRQSKGVKAYEPETEMHHLDYKSNAVKTDERESVQPSPDGQDSIHIQPSPEPGLNSSNSLIIICVL